MCIFHDIFRSVFSVLSQIIYTVYVYGLDFVNTYWYVGYYIITNPIQILHMVIYSIRSNMYALHDELRPILKFFCPFYIMKTFFGIDLRYIKYKEIFIGAAQEILKYADVTLQYGQSFDMLSFSYILDIISMLQGDL